MDSDEWRTRWPGGAGSPGGTGGGSRCINGSSPGDDGGRGGDGGNAGSGGPGGDTSTIRIRIADLASRSLNNGRAAYNKSLDGRAGRVFFNVIVAFEGWM
jgi:hypothetical protein